MKIEKQARFRELVDGVDELTEMATWKVVLIALLFPGFAKRLKRIIVQFADCMEHGDFGTDFK